MKNIYLISVLNLIFNYYSFSQTIIKVSDVEIDNEPFRESKYKDAVESKLNTKVLCYGDVSLKGMTPCKFTPF